MSNENPLEHILSCLEGVEEAPDGSYKALCPAHDDHDPSLSVTEKEDHKPLVHCFVCKDQQKVWRALEERGIARSDLFHRNGEGRGRNSSKKPKRRMCLTGVYDYRTPDGEFVRHHSLRFEPPPNDEQHHPKCRGEHCHSNRKDKDFRQARPNDDGEYVYGLDGVQTVLYNLGDVMQATMRGETVVWVEGEKDADNGKERLGLTTTTCPMGAKHFKPYYAGYFTGARVVVVADNDAPGREHAEMVAGELLPFAASVKVLKGLPGVPEGGDLTDWIDAGGTREEFERLSSLSQPYIAGGDGDDLFGAVRFTDLGEPEPRTFVVEDVVPQGHSILLHGGGGSAKSILAALLGISVSSGNLSEFLDHIILRHGPVLIIDFELDADEQHRRVKALCGGLGIAVPDDLYYLSGLGMNTREVFERAVKVCEKVGVVFAVIDSIGFAMRGDMESSRDVNTFFAEYVDPLRAIGVTPMIIDHQGKLQSGESYQRKTAFGSAFKEHRARSILQVEAVENNRDAGTLRVRLRHKKANFSSRLEPFDVELTFGAERIEVKTVELTAADNASEEALSATERIRLALREGDKTTAELSEYTGLSRAYLQNILPNLEREGTVRVVKTEGRTNTYGLPEPPDDDGPDGDGPDDDGEEPPDERSEESNAGSSGGSPTADTAEKPSSPVPPYIACGNGDDSEKPPRKSGDDEEKPEKTKKTKSPEEEEELRASLAEKFNYIYTEADVRRCRKWVKSAPEMALDIETYGKLKRDGLLYTRGKVRLIQLHCGGETWLIDCDFVEDRLVTPILEELEDKPKYLHNSLFDIPRLYRRFGVLLNQNVHDTILASRIARAGEWEKKFKVIQKGHSLEDCLQRELGIEIPKNRKLKWDGPLQEEHLEYATDDVAHLKELYEALQGVLREHAVQERYEAISSRLPDFTDAAVRGVPLDAGTLQPALDALEREKANLEGRLNGLAPEHPEGLEWVWGNTSKETSPQGRGRNGALRALSLLGVELSDLQDQTLLDHREAHELVHILYLYRKKANTLSRYSRWIADFYEEGRMYPQPKVAAAVTGRVLYSDPNAQGIDKHRTDEFRRCVRAANGRIIVKGDFAQQELRIAAYYSRDKNMLDAFANGEDIYLKTAAKLVGKTVGKDHPARQAAKRATLGFLYGLGTEKYRQNVYKDTGERLSASQANKDREAFRAAFPEFYRWQQIYGAKHEWETRSALGWRRVVAPDKDHKPKYTERLNGPIQSTAGDILYLTLEKLAADPRPGTHFLLSVHDELLLECPKEDARGVAQWLKAKMGEAMEEILGEELGGPRSVEVGYGPSWGECVELEES